MNIFEALEAAGFGRVATTTQGGEVIEYTYFDVDGIQVIVNYRHARAEVKPRKPYV